MGDQTSLDFPFFGLSRRSRELEVVGILQKLACEVGLELRERSLEVCARLALPLMEVALDPMNQDVPAPAVFNGRSGVPEPFLPSLDLLDKRQIVVPGDLCKRLLHN